MESDFQIADDKYMNYGDLGSVEAIIWTTTGVKQIYHVFTSIVYVSRKHHS